MLYLLRRAPRRGSDEGGGEGGGRDGGVGSWGDARPRLPTLDEGGAEGGHDGGDDDLREGGGVSSCSQKEDKGYTEHWNPYAY